MGPFTGHYLRRVPRCRLWRRLVPPLNTLLFARKCSSIALFVGLCPVCNSNSCLNFSMAFSECLDIEFLRLAVARGTVDFGRYRGSLGKSFDR